MGPTPQSPIPNPQSPIPNPQLHNFKKVIFKIKNRIINIFLNLNQYLIN
jgi:hypothetical protein